MGLHDVRAVVRLLSRLIPRTGLGLGYQVQGQGQLGAKVRFRVSWCQCLYGGAEVGLGVRREGG